MASGHSAETGMKTELLVTLRALNDAVRAMRAELVEIQHQFRLVHERSARAPRASRLDYLRAYA